MIKQYSQEVDFEETKKQYMDDIQLDGTTLIFNPFNPLNVEITQEDIFEILTTYGLPPVVNNINLYKRAFVHKSYLKKPDLENEKQNIVIAEQPMNCLSLKTKSNERLEYLGDGVLELTSKFIIYKRFPKANEGFMTNKKIALVKNESIGKLAIEIGLNKWLLLSKHAEEKNIRNNISKMGCLFEAFIGAIYLDMEKNSQGNGFIMASTFIENVFNRHVNWTEIISTDDNYKNILQVQIQKEFKVTPYYLELEYIAEKGYSMGVYLSIGYPHIIPGSPLHLSAQHYSSFHSIAEIKQYIETNSKILLFLGEGNHKIKKKAEQESCYNAIKNLEMIL